MRLLCLQGQNCTCPSIVHAAGVHFPSGAASHFGIFFTAGAKVRVYTNRCFEYDAEMTARTAHG